MLTLFQFWEADNGNHFWKNLPRNVQDLSRQSSRIRRGWRRGGGKRRIYSKPVTNKQQQTINHQQPESKHYSCGRSRCHYCPNIFTDNEITDLIVLSTTLEGLVISQYSPWHHLSTVPQYILYVAHTPLHTHMLFKRFSRYSKVVIGCLFILVLISLLKCHFFFLFWFWIIEVTYRLVLCCYLSHVSSWLIGE